MADTVNINLNVNADNSMKSLRQMKMEMKELQIQMTNTTDPTRFKQLEAEFAILRNDMKDTSAAMKYMDPGEILGGWVKMTQGVVGSFAAITGAMSLFGNESEEIQAIEKKSMAIIQVMMGLEQARQLLIDGGGKAERKTLISSTAAWLAKTLGIKSTTKATAENTVATKTNAVMTGAQTAATGGATIATRLLGVAMKALPIFAIIGAVVGLVAAFKSLFKGTEQSTAAMEAYKISSENVNNSLRESAELTADYIASAEDANIRLKIIRGEMTQGEADKLKNKQEYDKKYTESIEKASGDYARIEQKRRDADLKAAEAYDNIMAQGRDKFLEADAEANRIRNKAKREYDKEIEQNEKEHQTRITNAKKEFEDNNAIVDEQNRKDQINKWQQFWNSYLSAYRKWQDKVKDIQIGLIADEKERDLAKAEEDKKRMIRELEESEIFKNKLTNPEEEAKRLKLVKDAQIAIEQEYNKNVFAIYEKYDKEEEDKLKESVDYKKNIIEQNKKENDKYYDSLLAAGNLDEEQTKEILDKKRQSNYDYYNDLLKLAEDEAKKDGVVTAEELANIDKLIKKRDEYTKVIKAGDEVIVKSAKTTGEKVKEFFDKNQEQINLYADELAKLGYNLSSIFSNLTEMMMINIDIIDKAYNDRYESASTTLDKELEKAKKVWGEESNQYKSLVAEKTRIDDDKKRHDDKMEADRKAAQNKYAKAQISIQMATATSELAKGLVATWTGSIMELGPVAGPILATALSGVLLGVYGAQMALMSKQMSAVGKMKLGGLITGPSHENGGVMRELEGGEAVINARSMSMPGVRGIASRLNELGGGVAFDNSDSSLLTVDSDSIANTVIKSVKGIPIYVSLNDINDANKKVQVIQNKTSF